MSDRGRSASVGTDDCSGPHLGIDRRALHLVENVSDLLQIGDVSTVWIEGPVPRRSLGEGINEEFLNTTWVDLEMEFVRDRI